VKNGRVVFRMLAAVVCAGLAACGPLSEHEREYRRRQQAQKRQQQILEALKAEQVVEDEVIRLVKESHPGGGELAVEEWLDQLASKEPGTVRFPRWEVRRQGRDRATVCFSYVVIGAGAGFVRKTVQWEVDLATHQVSEPQVVTGEVRRAAGRRGPSRGHSQRRPEDRWGEEALK